MGLDMYAFRPLLKSAPWISMTSDAARLFYWRKHPDLHGWIEALYRSMRDGRDFNLIPVRLEQPDIDALEAAVKTETLPATSVFVFGESKPEHNNATSISSEARAAIADGRRFSIQAGGGREPGCPSYGGISYPELIQALPPVEGIASRNRNIFQKETQGGSVENWVFGSGMDFAYARKPPLAGLRLRKFSL